MIINENVIEADFLIIPDDTKYWFVRAGSKAEFYYDFKYNNFIAIGDNEIKLKNLNGIPDRFRALNSTLKLEYKRLFNEEYLNSLMDSQKYKDLQKSEQSDEIEKVKRSSSISSSKTFSFVEEMDIGDYILVPYKSSDVFLIGIVISDVFDHQVEHEYLGIDQQYPISDYEKKRRILWIKEIGQKELPEKLMWIQNGHRAIFDITSSADDINPLLSTEFIYKGNASVRVNVGTENKVSSSTWLQYQIVINQNAQGQADEVFQKNKVQSVGHTILEMAIDNPEILIIIGASLFHEMDFNVYGIKFKTHGPLSFLIPGSKKKRENENRNNELDLEKKEEEVKSLKLNNNAIEINNKKETILLEELKKRSDLTNRTAEDIKITDVSISKNPEQQEALNNMKISQKSIGTEISPERQKVIQNLVKTEFEQ